MVEKCKALNPNFEVGKTLMGIVIDWSDAEIGGLTSAIEKEPQLGVKYTGHDHGRESEIIIK